MIASVTESSDAFCGEGIREPRAYEPPRAHVDKSRNPLAFLVGLQEW